MLALLGLLKGIGFSFASLRIPLSDGQARKFLQDGDVPWLGWGWGRGEGLEVLLKLVLVLVLCKELFGFAGDLLILLGLNWAL